MGLLTLQSLIADVRSGLGNRTDITDQTLVNDLNVAQSQLARVFPFEELRKTAEKTNGLSPDAKKDKYLKLPPRAKKIHTLVRVEGTLSGKLIEKPWRMLDEAFPCPEADPRDRPVYYTRWGELIILTPVPDKVYTFSMKYTADPTPFVTTNPNQLSDFDFKDDILVSLACSRRWGLLGQHEKADEHLQKASTELTTIMRDAGETPDMDPTPLKDMVNGPYWANPFIKGVIGG
jgi:hypothetical protein